MLAVLPRTNGVTPRAAFKRLFPVCLVPLGALNPPQHRGNAPEDFLDQHEAEGLRQARVTAGKVDSVLVADDLVNHGRLTLHDPARRMP